MSSLAHLPIHHPPLKVLEDLPHWHVLGATDKLYSVITILYYLTLKIKQQYSIYFFNIIQSFLFFEIFFFIIFIKFIFSKNNIKINFYFLNKKLILTNQWKLNVFQPVSLYKKNQNWIISFNTGDNALCKSCWDTMYILYIINIAITLNYIQS